MVSLIWAIGWKTQLLASDEALAKPETCLNEGNPDEQVPTPPLASQQQTYSIGDSIPIPTVDVAKEARSTFVKTNVQRKAEN